MSRVEARIRKIGNIDVFLESVTIASACNKVLRKRSLKPKTIGLIPSGGYTVNVNYSNKAIVWLVYREQTDACTIRYGRNGRKYRPSELPSLSVGGFCAETRIVYEFIVCLFHGHTCLPFRDITNLGGDTLAERYEQTMARLQRITGAGYTVEVLWECQFDKDILSRYPELKHHPIMQHAPLNTRKVLYGGRTEGMVLHYSTREGETFQYYDVMSLYPYVCKYSKFLVRNPKIHVGDKCRDKQAMLGKESLIKCTALPPKILYHPVLPFRCNYFYFVYAGRASRM